MIRTVLLGYPLFDASAAQPLELHRWRKSPSEREINAVRRDLDAHAWATELRTVRTPDEFRGRVSAPLDTAAASPGLILID